MQFELLHYGVIWCNNLVVFLFSGFSFSAQSQHSVHICRLPNLPISCDIILMWIDFVVPFNVSRTMWRHQETTKVRNTSVKLPFSLIFTKKIVSIPWVESGFISLMNFNTGFYIVFMGFPCAIWPDAFALCLCAKGRLNGVCLPF